MRFLLTTWGSHGDLHPFLALGRGLIARGHQVTLVGNPDWSEECARAGVRFVATGEPSRRQFLRQHPEVLSMRAGGLVSLRALVRHAIAPGLESVLAALLAETSSHDVIVAHHFSFPGPIAAEISGLPFATVSLAPGVVPSSYTLPGANFGRAGRSPVHRVWNTFLWSCGSLVSRATLDPIVNDLRARHGLAPVRDVIFSAHSERLNLQLYSAHFAERPPDWSAEKQITGFCYYDPPDARLPQDVVDFLAGGDKPVLCTLGSVAVQNPGSFYQDAAVASRTLGLRGILLLGSEDNRPANLPETILATPYVPFGLLMPHVSAVVHQCGVGTLSHTLRAGVPSVACPFAFDQPNNARRLEELGAAEIVLPRNRDAAHITGALKRLLEGPDTARAKALGAAVRAEDGVARACELIESTF